MSRTKKYFSTICPFAILILLMGVFPTWALSSQGKNEVEAIHAAQVLLFKCDSVDEVEQMLKRLKSAGVDTIIVRVFQNRYDRVYRFIKPKHKVGVYFQTEHAPVVGDILSTVISISRKQGLKVFAWMTTRQCDWVVEKHPRWVDKKYDFKSREYIADKKVDLFHPEAQKYFTSLYRDLAMYDIDGILFQDDLVYRYTEGFSPAATRAFSQETLIKADPSLLYKKIVNRAGKYYAVEFSTQFWDWVRWKNRSILKFTHVLVQNMKQLNPTLKIALNLYYETVMEPKNGLAWLAQDFQESLKYDFDYFSVMAYHLQVQKEHKLTDSQVIQKMETLASRLVEWLDNPSRALIKLQVKDWKTGKREYGQRLEKVFQAVTEKGKTSLAFIPCDKNTPLQTIERYFKPKKKIAQYRGSVSTSNN